MPFIFMPFTGSFIDYVGGEYMAGIGEIKAKISIDLSALRRGLQEVGSSISSATNNIRGMTTTLNQVETRAEHTGTSLRGIGDDANTGANNTRSALSRVETAFAGIRSACSTAGTKIKETFKESQKSIKQFTDKLDETGDKLSELADGITPITTALAGFAIAGVGASENIDNALKKVNTQLGLTGDNADALKENISNVAKTGVGGFDEVAESLVIVKKNFKDLDGKELEDMTIKAMHLADVTGSDVNETMRTASQLANNFGISGDKAMDLITKGFQNGLNNADDFNDTIKEYSQDFHNLGFSSEEFFSILDNGLKNGAMNTDVVADAWREFGIKVREGEDTVGEAFKNAGVNYNDFITEFNKGGESSQKAIQGLVESVMAIDDPLKRQQTAVAIWGTKVEDMGLGVIDVFGDVGNAYDDVNGSAEKLAKDNESFTQRMRGAWNTLQEAIKPVGDVLKNMIAGAVETIVPMVEKLGNAFANLPAPIQNAIVIIGGVIAGIAPVLLGVAGGIKLFSGVLKTLAPVISGIKAGFAGLATAIGGISAPVVAVVAVIGVLVGAFIYAWNNVDGFKEGVIKAWNVIKDAVTDAVEAVWSTIQDVWSAIKPYVMDTFNSIKEIISSVFTTVVTVVTTVVKAVWSVIQTVWGLIQPYVTTIFTGVFTVISGIWQTISSFISGIMNVIKDIFTGNWDAIGGHIKDACSGIWDGIKTIWDGIKTYLSGMMGALGDLIKAGWEVVKSVTSSILNAVKSVISSIWNGIKSAISSVLNAIKSVISSVWNSIKSTVTSILNAISSTASSIWNGIKSTISSVVNGISSTVSSVFNGIKSTATSIWNGIKTAITSPIESAKSTVLGIVNNIKSAFNNMKITIPKPKLPHISVGSKSVFGGKVSIPTFSIDWYKTGAIATGASVVGVGEKGDEAIVPLSDKHRMKPFASAVADMMQEHDGGSDGDGTVNNNFNISSLVVREEADIDRIAEKLETLQRREKRKRGLK